MPGNTRTGGVLEAMILPALDRGGYQHRAQVAIGDRLGCGRHVVDAVAEKDAKAYLVLGGEGWKLRQFYAAGGLSRFLPLEHRVEILTLEAFVGKANQGRL